MILQREATDTPRFDRSRRRVLTVVALALAMDALRRAGVSAASGHGASVDIQSPARRSRKGGSRR